MFLFDISVQLLSCVRLCDPMDWSMPGFLVYHHLPELAQTNVHRVADAIQPSHPLSSLLLSSIFPSIRVFSNESTLCIRWLKYWSFRFSISPSNKYSGLISLRIVWFDLLAVEGTLKSLLQHHSSEASILGHSAFFMVQLSHPYVTTAKTKNQRWFNIKVGELRKWPYFFSFPILANLIFFKKYVDRFLSTPSSYWFLSSRMRTPRPIEQPLVSTPSPVTRAFPPTLPQMAVQVQMEPEPSGPWRTTVQWV